jgi:hypothetical protein
MGGERREACELERLRREGSSRLCKASTLLGSSQRPQSHHLPLTLSSSCISRCVLTAFPPVAFSPPGSSLLRFLVHPRALDYLWSLQGDWILLSSLGSRLRSIQAHTRPEEEYPREALGLVDHRGRFQVAQRTRSEHSPIAHR